MLSNGVFDIFASEELGFQVVLSDLDWEWDYNRIFKTGDQPDGCFWAIMFVLGIHNWMYQEADDNCYFKWCLEIFIVGWSFWFLLFNETTDFGRNNGFCAFHDNCGNFSEFIWSLRYWSLEHLVIWKYHDTIESVSPSSDGAYSRICYFSVFNKLYEHLSFIWVEGCFGIGFLLFCFLLV